jgi:hypothetical protein
LLGGICAANLSELLSDLLCGVVSSDGDSFSVIWNPNSTENSQQSDIIVDLSTYRRSLHTGTPQSSLLPKKRESTSDATFTRVTYYPISDCDNSTEESFGRHSDDSFRSTVQPRPAKAVLQRLHSALNDNTPVHVSLLLGYIRKVSTHTVPRLGDSITFNSISRQCCNKLSDMVSYFSDYPTPSSSLNGDAEPSQSPPADSDKGVVGLTVALAETASELMWLGCSQSSSTKAKAINVGVFLLCCRDQEEGLILGDIITSTPNGATR